MRYVNARDVAALGRRLVPYLPQLGQDAALSPERSPTPAAPVYLLHGSYRGFTYRIDPTRYRILTAEFGIPQKARDICGGSVARIIWRVAGQLYDSVSEDIVVNSRADANVVDRLIVDMATLPVDPGSPNPLTWNGGAGAGIARQPAAVQPVRVGGLRRQVFSSAETRVVSIPSASRHRAPTAGS